MMKRTVLPVTLVGCLLALTAGGGRGQDLLPPPTFAPKGSPPQGATPEAAKEGAKEARPIPKPLKGLDPKREKELLEKVEKQLPPNPPSILTGKFRPIDLASALRLAGVENPDILLARQRVVEAIALRQRAMAMVLPSLNYGMNYDAHQGTLQQSNGNILRVNRDALYAGLGANAIAAGTVNIPGLVYNLNISDGIFGALLTRQLVRVRQFESIAVANDMLLRVAVAYVELLRAECRRVIAIQNRDQIRDIARLTTVFAQTGEGKQSDADRAITELGRRNDELLAAEGELLVASARLARLINLDPSCVLFAIDGWVVPTPLVPNPIPLKQLIFIAINQRPELAARRALIQQASLAVSAARWLPFSPNVILGYSTGTFGGGSNLVAQPGGFLGFHEPRFDSFAGRQDFDVVAYWTAQNLGVGNLATIRLAQSDLQARNIELVRTLNRVRYEVAAAQARTFTRFSQIDVGERAVTSGRDGYRADYERITLGQGLPIELVDSFRLLSDARYRYLDAVTEYNRAQFELYVSLGKPPLPMLSRAVPSNLVPPGADMPPGTGSVTPPADAKSPSALPAPSVDKGERK